MSRAGGALRFYLRGKTRSLWRYALSETLQGLIGWIPGLPGIGLRALAYKSVLGCTCSTFATCRMRGFIWAAAPLSERAA
jgi:hypothetical protein